MFLLFLHFSSKPEPDVIFWRSEPLILFARSTNYSPGPAPFPTSPLLAPRVYTYVHRHSLCTLTAGPRDCLQPMARRRWIVTSWASCFPPAAGRASFIFCLPLVLKWRLAPRRSSWRPPSFLSSPLPLSRVVLVQLAHVGMCWSGQRHACGRTRHQRAFPACSARAAQRWEQETFPRPFLTPSLPSPPSHRVFVSL